MARYLALILLSSVGSSFCVAAANFTAEPPFLLECRIPEDLPVSNDSFVDRTDLTAGEMEQLLTEGRCFLACATLQYENEVGEWNTSLSESWPVLNDNANCNVSGNVHECTRGCLRAAHDDPRNDHTNCTNVCAGGCTPGCDSLTTQCHPWIHAGCPITCHEDTTDPQNPCYKGCSQEFLLNIILPMHESAPRAPSGPPVLIPQRNMPGQFVTDLSSAIPEANEGSGEPATNSTQPQQLVTFLFRFEEVNSSNVFYNWTVTPYAELDLLSYVCQELLVSFAVSNRAGISNFSLPARVMVHGDERLIPNPPTNIQLSDEMDTRIGFFGHVILNVTWDRPQNEAHVDNYTVVVSTADGQNVTMCGEDFWTTMVPNEITSVTVVANSSSSLPVMTCRYKIQIYSVGRDGRSDPLEQLYNIETTFDVDKLSFECQRLWQIPEYLFWFNLTWTLPPYIYHGNVISAFVVVPKLKDGSEIITLEINNASLPFFEEDPSVLKFSQILKPDDHEINTTYYMPQRSNTREYYLETYVTWNSSSIPYTPPAHPYTCTESAVSPAPSVVENFTVDAYKVNGSQITLNLDWTPPTIPNGDLAPYNVCIGREPLALDEIDPGSDEGHTCTTLAAGMTNNVTLFFVSHDLLYVQIRAHNQYRAGNWSDYYIIEMDSALATTFEDNSTKPSTQTRGTDSVTDSGPSVNVPRIVGACIGGIMAAALLVCCVCLVCCYVKRVRQRKKMWRAMAQPCDPMFTSGTRNTLFDKPSSASLNVRLLDDWEIPANEVIMEKLLGEGAFGEVYKGIVKCPIVNPTVRSSVKNSICTPVAIKLLKISAKGNERQDFLSEIEMMKKVAEGQNPHVVCLLGCVTIQEPLCLITEFVKYGDLLSYLRTNRRMMSGSSNKDDADAYVELGNVSPVDLISFAYQIASGMEYLSSLGIVHRDLACRNILVDEGKSLKITDFGMSRETDEIYVQKRTGRVPLKWMAIESIIAREFTSASDVWSYGITLWEIGTLGGFPYPSIQNEEFLPLLKRGYRMEKPDNCSPEVYDIMLTCWHEQPLKRPTFTELRGKFDSMLMADRNEEYIDLRIDHSQLYYQLLSTTTTENGLKSFHSFGDRKSCDIECSPKSPLAKGHLTSAGLKTPCSASTDEVRSKNYRSNEDCSAGTDAVRDVRDRIYQNAGRPVSMYLSRDHDKKERQNPYVDEPSRAAATALTLPNTNRLPEHWRSDGAIEMSPMENGGVHATSGPITDQGMNGPEITVTVSED